MSKRLLFGIGLLATAATLPGCSEGGGLASAPAPAGGASAGTSVYSVSSKVEIGAELPPTPATSAGAYEVIGIRNLTDASGKQVAAATLDPGQLKLTVEPASKTYTVEFDPGVFPGIDVAGNKLSYSIVDPKFNHIVTETTHLSDGTTKVSNETRVAGVAQRPITVDAAVKDSEFWAITANEKRYVSLGQWRWLQGPDHGEIYFVYGERTAPAEIPATGTATYVTGIDDFLEYRAIGYNLDDVSIKLAADFAGRSITANMSLAFFDSFTGTHDQPNLSGGGPITAMGNFDIALTGVINSSVEKSDPVSGSISGAFFGPDAVQVGATFLLSHSGEPKITGAFIGVRQ